MTPSGLERIGRDCKRQGSSIKTKDAGSKTELRDRLKEGHTKPSLRWRVFQMSNAPYLKN